MKVDCIIERPPYADGPLYRWQLRWTEPDVVNHRRIKRLFLGRVFKDRKDTAFELTVFKHDVSRNFGFKV